MHMFRFVGLRVRRFYWVLGLVLFLLPSAPMIPK